MDDASETKVVDQWVKVEVPDTGITTPNVRIRWELPSSVLAKVRADEMTDVRIVVCVFAPVTERWGGLDSTRYVQTWFGTEPLLLGDKGQAKVLGGMYVPCKTVGANLIICQVVNVTDRSDLKDLERLASGKASAWYRGKTLQLNGVPGVGQSCEALVDIPGTVFPKPPAKWQTWLTRQVLGVTATSECQHGTNLFWSLVLAPFMVLLTLPFRVIVLLIALFFGLRNIRWSGLNPLNRHYFPLPELSDDWHTWYRYDRYDDRRTYRFAFFWLQPWLILWIATGYHLLAGRWSLGWLDWLKAVGATCVVMAVLCAISALVTAVVVSISRHRSKARRERMSAKRQRAREARTQQADQVYTQLSYLLPGVADRDQHVEIGAPPHCRPYPINPQ